MGKPRLTDIRKNEPRLTDGFRSVRMTWDWSPDSEIGIYISYEFRISMIELVTRFYDSYLQQL